MIKVGLVNIDTSHAGAFAEYMLKGDRAKFTAVYNDGFRGDGEVDGFMRKFGVAKRYEDIGEMAGDADIGFVLGCNWDTRLRHAMPFINCGKPVFIDKPFAGNIGDCMRLEELARGGAVILGSSSVRYARELCGFFAIPEAERGRLLHIYGTVGVDEFNYPIHISEAIGGMDESPVASCRYIGGTDAGEIHCETFALRFESGLTAAFSAAHGVYQPFETVIMTTKTTYHYSLGASGALYQDMLDRVFDYMETGRNTLAPVPKMTEAVKTLLAGRLSRVNGGAEILLSGIPESDPGFDGHEFEKEYAAASKPIYLYDK